MNTSYTTYIMTIQRLKKQHVSTVNSHHQALCNSYVNYSVNAHIGSLCYIYIIITNDCPFQCVKKPGKILKLFNIRYDILSCGVRHVDVGSCCVDDFTSGLESKI
jgi:hypothetical protein